MCFIFINSCDGFIPGFVAANINMKGINIGFVENFSHFKAFSQFSKAVNTVIRGEFN